MNKPEYVAVYIENGYASGVTKERLAGNRDKWFLCDAQHANVPEKFEGLPVYHLERAA